jgi:hypothetical protein
MIFPSRNLTKLRATNSRITLTSLKKKTMKSYLSISSKELNTPNGR